MVDHVPREHARTGALARTLLIALLALGAPWVTSCGSSPGAGAASGHDASGPVLQPASAREILAAVESNDANTIVLNVWATWCGPCREEFPDLLKLRRDHANDGLDLMLVSADFDDQWDEAVAFLKDQGVDFPTWIKTGDDMEFIDSLNPEWTGALPATFVYDAQGRLTAFWEGKATFEEMEDRVLPVLTASR